MYNLKSEPENLKSDIKLSYCKKKYIKKKKAVYFTLKKLSTYCSTYKPQSVKFDCWGTFGQLPFIVSFEKIFSLPIFALYSQLK